MNERDMTPSERAAILFVALMAEHVDEQAGIKVRHGTRETQKRVAAIVRAQFFEPKPAALAPPKEPSNAD